MGKSKVYKLLSGFNSSKWRLTYKSIFVGVIAGILVSLYRIGIEFGTETALSAYSFLRGNPLYILPWFLLGALVSWITYKLIKLEPYAKGSGIPQVEGIVLLGMKIKWHTVLAVRFLAGLLTSFFGLSVGREGPSIQIGAAGAQAFCRHGEKNKVEKNYLITAGAAAGLSAAFNAPLSGVMFALEEVHRSFSPRILVAATGAALVADMISTFFFGLSPVLGFLNVPELPLQLYPWLILVGIVSGMVGSLINKLLLASGPVYERLPAPLRIAAALLFALPCGLLLPQVLGGGQSLVQLVSKLNTGAAILFLLFVVKILFTCVSFGSGVPGGIFLPILSIGALSGSILGIFAERLGLPQAYVTVFFVCSMAGALASSVKAPVTSILLMAEMTGSLVQLLPVALVAFVALFASDVLKVTPIYEVLLERITPPDGEQIDIRKKGALMEIPVELGSEAAGKKISEIAWPAGLLVVGLHRGEKELVPNGDTQILHGDYLIVLSSALSYGETHSFLCGLCRCGED